MAVVPACKFRIQPVLISFLLVYVLCSIVPTPYVLLAALPSKKCARFEEFLWGTRLKWRGALWGSVLFLNPECSPPGSDLVSPKPGSFQGYTSRVPATSPLSRQARFAVGSL